METRHDNRLRNRNIEYNVHFPELPATASGTRFFQTILDPAVGSEVVLVLVDQTNFAHQLANRNPFELRLKTGAARTSIGPLAFLLWWVPPVSNGMPFALYEHLLNPTERSALEMVQRLSAQTHLHVLLIGPGQELLDCYEFVNTFECDALLPIIESALMGPALDFEAAKWEYEQMFDLPTLFQMEPIGQAADEGDGDRGGECASDYRSAVNSAVQEPPAQLALDILADQPVESSEQLSDEGSEHIKDARYEAYEPEHTYPLDWSVVERSAKLAFSIWMGQPELIWAKKAFGVLTTAGLIEDTDAFSRQIAVFRVLVLGGIYRDFCDAAWEETSWIEYAEWCEPEEIADRFVIGQLFAKMPDWDEDEEIEFSVAVDRLVEAEREVVVEALLKAFGGTAALYASLWQSRNDNDDPDEFEDDDCFEPDDDGKLKAYQWVSDGCARIADAAE